MPCYGDACVDPTYDNLRYQDNTIIRRPGKNGASDIYFRFSKGDHPGDGINVATSDSLSGQWHLNFTILGQLSDISKSDCVSGTYKSQNFANSDLNRWAPEVHFINNQYYLFYTVEDQKNGYCFDQCVATSPSMDAGTWTDHG
ncbi:hypothetical protein PRZ48_011425 [Zasmidium cellare]|uniref:Uncharacterized protein n=1 Tax=Zasmidium cellare TaxID=395010 RepID=A0ABR0E6X5_ZASCE|nr:hypothetical protein PRZ48_011425 [Zasmidium cellare]